MGAGRPFSGGHGLGPWPGARGSQPPAGPGPGRAGMAPGGARCSPLAHLEGPVGGAVGLGPARAGEPQGGGAPCGPAPAPAVLQRPRNRGQRPLLDLHRGAQEDEDDGSSSGCVSSHFETSFSTAPAGGAGGEQGGKGWPRPPGSTTSRSPRERGRGTRRVVLSSHLTSFSLNSPCRWWWWWW